MPTKASDRHAARRLTSIQPASTHGTQHSTNCGQAGDSRALADRLAPGEAPPAWVSLDVGAERVSLCSRTLRRAIASGELPGYKFGSAIRVRLDELDAWAASKAMPNARSGAGIATGRRGGVSR